MPTLIPAPSVIEAAGNKPKRIEEYAGRVNSGHAEVSVARMQSPEGWVEPGQRPEFQEITVVLRGMLRVEHEGGALDVRAGQAVVQHPGEWVRYSTPSPAAPSTLPSACPPSPPPPCTAIRTDPQARPAIPCPCSLPSPVRTLYPQRAVRSIGHRVGRFPDR